MTKVICLMGPTAVGKTALAISMVRSFPLEIISVDSALIYRGMNIGTAKPSPEELAQAPHHLIDILDPSQHYSAADFVKDATQICQEIHARGKIPFLVGGTMMYFKALEQGIATLPSANPTIRQMLLRKAEQNGWEMLHQELASIDPQSAARIHPHDPQRIQRALEVYYASGKTLSAWWSEQSSQSSFEFINIGLMPSDRSWLHDRIAARWNAMLSQGFVDEVKQLMTRQDLHPDLPSMRTVGYRQIWEYCLGQIDETTLHQKGLAATRQLAKRQMTWLRHWPDLYLLDPCDSTVESQCREIIAQSVGR